MHIVALCDNANVVESVLSSNPRIQEKKLTVTVAELKQTLRDTGTELYHVRGEDNA